MQFNLPGYPPAKASVEIWRQFARKAPPSELLKLARDSDAPVEVLEDLLDLDDILIHLNLLKNPKIPTDLVDKLSQSSRASIREQARAILKKSIS